VSTATDIRRAAREALGLDDLRPGQAEAAAAVVGGSDTLAVMPTGSGKSAIYQIAAVLLDGPTIVVSPLVALQRDQVEAIGAQRSGAAALVNATIGEGRRREAFDRLAASDLEFLFLAPEQLAKEETVEAVAAAHPSLFVVDEAHLVSSWGHDFRPDYLRLGGVRDAVGRPTLLALTATAAPPVREDVIVKLGMRDPTVLVRGFDRPNIHLAVEHHHDADRKEAALREHLAGDGGPGLVYVPTRRAAEEIAADLRDRGVRAAAYHAGLPVKERRVVQDAFLAGELDVVAATTAFGMGIDKPDVRYVHHSAPSESLDAYYQEIGRAGRDGGPARAVLFHRQEDLGIRRFFAAGGKVKEEDLAEVGEVVADHDAPVSEEELQAETGLSGRKLTQAVNALEEADAVRRLPHDRLEVVDADRVEEAVAEAAHDGEVAAAIERSRVEMMRQYAETTDCRRQFLLNYFGEEYERRCGNCDNCDRGTTTIDAEGPFPLSTRVRHTLWGEGLVLRYEAGTVTVLFDEVGYKSLSLEVVESAGLLEEVG